jgi:hypothetical protein
MRTSIPKVIASSVGAAGAGAALMYFLDPTYGRRRRALLRDKASSLTHVAGWSAARAARDLTNRARGLAAETKSRFSSDVPDDEVLEERVRSHMGRIVSYPDAIDVSARNGEVTLRGDILSSELTDLVSSTYSQHGVTNVRNKLRSHRSCAGIPGHEHESSGHHHNGFRLRPGPRLLLGIAGGALTAYGATRHDKFGRVLSTVGLGLVSSEVSNVGLVRLVRAIT